MNGWWKISFGVLCGLLGAGILFLAGRPPRGEAVTLLPPPTPAPVAVHVTGAVAQPGVYSLPAGSRVQDALQAAGGLLPKADQQTLNLAAFLQDGNKIIIPFQPTVTPTPRELSALKTTPASAGGSPVPSTPALININTASLSELESLPGIGPAIGQRIIDYRNAHGPFSKIEDIMNVSGIGEKTFEKIKDLITVGP